MKLFEQSWSKFIKRPAPGQPFVRRTLRFMKNEIDAMCFELVHGGLWTIFLGAGADEQQLELFIESSGIFENTIKGCFNYIGSTAIKKTAEGAYPGKLIRIGKYCSGSLRASPR